jgi:hypothetical protein
MAGHSYKYDCNSHRFLELGWQYNKLQSPHRLKNYELSEIPEGVNVTHWLCAV